MIEEVAVETEELYNFDQLHEIASGNPDFIKSLASIFLQTVPGDAALIVAASKAGDWQTVSKLAHKLKSTIDSMNIYSLKTKIRTLEMDAKNKINTAGLSVLAENVLETINQVAGQVRTDFAI